MGQTNRSKKIQLILTKKFLIQEYTKNKKSACQIAKENALNDVTIGHYLKKYEISIRNIFDTIAKVLTKSFLINGYIKCEKSIVQLAKETGFSRSAIVNHLKEFKIKMRNHIEAIEIKFKNPYQKYYCKCGNEISRNTVVYGKNQCLFCANQGKNNPMFDVHRCGKDAFNWQGGLSFEPYTPEFNKQLKESIRKRDNYTCQLCNIKQKELKGFFKKLSIHHIDYDKDNLNDDNLVALCHKCNIKVNFNRNYWYAYFTYLMEEKLKCLIKK